MHLPNIENNGVYWVIIGYILYEKSVIFAYNKKKLYLCACFSGYARQEKE